jgi:hypothetical protein
LEKFKSPGKLGMGRWRGKEMEMEDEKVCAIISRIESEKEVTFKEKRRKAWASGVGDWVVFDAEFLNIECRCRVEAMHALEYSREASSITPSPTPTVDDGAQLG